MRSTTPFLAILATAGIAGCGSSSSPVLAVRAPDPMISFAKCMRAHGVSNFPDPGSNGSGGIQIDASQRAGSGGSMKVNGVSVSSPAFHSAMLSCRSQLPNGGHPPPLSAARKAAMLRFAQCMRAHGVPNFPDPTFNSGGPVELALGSKGGPDPRSPAFQQAQKACGGPGGPIFKGGP